MSDLNSDDYYKVLGVDKNASEKDIKRAYRKLAVKHHPDRNPDDRKAAEERFKKIGEAYGVLSDADQKKKYDQFGKQGLKGGMGGMNIDPNQIFKMFFQSGGFGNDDPFGGMFGSSGFGGRGGPQMGGFPFGNMGGFSFGGQRGHGHGHGHGFGRPQRPRSVPSPLQRGTKVILYGLSNANYNGVQGRILSFTGERFVIDVANCPTINKDQISIKPENVCQLKTLITYGLSNDDLNDQEVEARGYNGSRDRIQCRFPDGSTKAVRPVNLQIPTGSMVRIAGLSDDRLNGKWGKIVQWVAPKDRYEVEIMNTTRSYKIKYQNVFL